VGVRRRAIDARGIGLDLWVDERVVAIYGRGFDTETR
jgi:hypothetical protein